MQVQILSWAPLLRSFGATKCKQKHMSDKEKLESTEFERFLERYELKRVRDNFKDRVLTIVIASLGLIAALAWDTALKHLFEKILGGEGALTEEIAYAIIITVIAAAISVYLGRTFVKNKEKIK